MQDPPTTGPLSQAGTHRLTATKTALSVVLQPVTSRVLTFFGLARADDGAPPLKPLPIPWWLYPLAIVVGVVYSVMVGGGVGSRVFLGFGMASSVVVTYLVYQRWRARRSADQPSPGSNTGTAE